MFDDLLGRGGSLLNLSAKAIYLVTMKQVSAIKVFSRSSMTHKPLVTVILVVHRSQSLEQLDVGTAVIFFNEHRPIMLDSAMPTVYDYKNRFNHSIML